MRSINFPWGFLRWLSPTVVGTSVFAALQTLMDFGGRSDKHRTAPVVMPKIYDSVEKKYQDMKYVSDALGLYSKGPP